MEDHISNSRVLRKLRALETINNKSIHPLDMAGELYTYGVLSAKQLEEIKTSNNKSELLFRALELANKEGRVDLLDYEWQLLPMQRITITIVTSSGIKEYRHEEP
jgi:hypothetical protein